ncbi:MAG TPA: hypothetical protein VJB08_04690 [Candidatus Nanoarchaeia archaeon]|nr:hypothetical protein [Candidatus Nanoarchaeia archaeon]
MVMVTLDIPKDINKKIEHFKIDNNLKDKRDAILLALRKSMDQEDDAPSMEEMFRIADSIKQKRRYSTKEAIALSHALRRKR